MISVVQLTQPAVEPVTIEDLGNWADAAIADINGTPDEKAQEILEGLIADQRQALEMELGRATVNSTWKVTLDRDDVKAEIVLPVPPLVSVTTVVTYDSEDAATTNATTVYQTIAGNPGRIVLREGQTWPTDLREYAAMEISITAGYGTDPTSVPGPLRVAIKQLATFFYRADRGTGMFEGTGGFKGEIPDQVAKIFRRLGAYDARAKVA